MKKIWKRLFVTLASVFCLFSLAILITNTTILRTFFVWYEKGILSDNAVKILSLDLSDTAQATETLEAIESNANVEIAIVEHDRLIYYTTRHSALFDDLTGFDLGETDGATRGHYAIVESEIDENGGMFATVRDRQNKGYLVYAINDDVRQVQLIMELSLITNSATVAAIFCLMITGVCLFASLVWAVYYARRFARPISEMNRIAVDMTNLDFSRKVEPNSKDEIGQLAVSINNLSDSLNATMTELQEKNKRLENEIEQERKLDVMRKGFVANVSHELKTPLSIIRGYAEGLRDGMAEDKASRDQYVDVILDESDRMYQLIIRLLELSKVEGGLEIRPTEFDLAASVLSVLDVMSPQLEQKRVDLKLEVPEKLTVSGDVMLLEQAMRNYIANAISHVGEGGTVRVYTEAYHDNVRLCVFNSGSALAEEEMGDIWEPFYRADQSHNRKEGRYGLGLSIVKAIMVAHQTDFGVFSTDDGVTFWLEVETK